MNNRKLSLQSKNQNFPIKTIPKPSSESTSVIDVQTNSNPITHSPQIIPFYDPSFFKYKTYFQGFFLPDDYSLDLKTLQAQQSQKPILEMRNLSFLHVKSLAIFSYTHITNDFHSFLLMNYNSHKPIYNKPASS